jgi:hypothetical protein
MNTIPLMTRDEFLTRADQVMSVSSKKANAFFALLGLGFLSLGIFVLTGADDRLPEWVTFVSIGAVVIGGMGGAVAAMLEWPRAIRRMGLECPACRQPLPGGKHAEVTQRVARTGCCDSCGTRVLEGEVEPSSIRPREAEPMRTALPIARAVSGPELRARLERFNALRQRRIYISIGVGFLGQLATVGLVLSGTSIREHPFVFLPIPVLFFAVLIWSVASTGSLARTLDLDCPSCGKPLVSGRRTEVARTGVCPNCQAVVVDL